SKIKTGLRRILLEHPEYRFAGLYDKKNNLLLTRLQPGHEQDEVFCALTQEEIKGVASWLPLEASKMVEGVRTAAEKEERPVGFEGWWTGAENQQTYWNFAYFIPPGVAKDRVTLGMVAFDGDYLRKSFLPAMMKDVLTSKSIVLRGDANPPVMMIHPPKDSTPWVASANWDGGKPEMERAFTDVFPRLHVAIKYQGTTVADLGTKFLRYNNIVDFSRIEAGRKEYEFKETNLAELVHSTLESYRFQIQQNGFAFEENISGDIPPVIVDREAIAGSLLNLLNNALKYSKDRKYIGVSLYRSNSRVNLEVQDRGIGIPKNEQEKIFEKFYRCGDALVHNIKGSGLG